MEPELTHPDIIFFDSNRAFVRAVEDESDNWALERRMSFIHCSVDQLSGIASMPIDCIVSPANSFGLMDGGIDLALSEFFGWDLQKQVQARICGEYGGEQPVGTSFIIETGHLAIPFLAHTPTMRLPEDKRGTDAPYVAMLALLQATTAYNRLHRQNPIRSVAVCGLGTGCGKVPVDSAARQQMTALGAFEKGLQAVQTGWDWGTAVSLEVDRAIWGP